MAVRDVSKLGAQSGPASTVRSNRSEDNGRLLVRSNGHLSRKSSKRVQTGEPHSNSPGRIRTLSSRNSPRLDTGAVVDQLCVGAGEPSDRCCGAVGSKRRCPDGRCYFGSTVQGFIGCQLHLFHLTLVEIPNPGLQRRFGNRAHLESQSNGVLGWPAARRGANHCGSGQVCAVEVRGSGTTRTDWSARVKVSLCQITTGLRPVCSLGRYAPRSAHQTSPRIKCAPLRRVRRPTQ